MIKIEVFGIAVDRGYFDYLGLVWLVTLSDGFLFYMSYASFVWVALLWLVLTIFSYANGGMRYFLGFFYTAVRLVYTGLITTL